MDAQTIAGILGILGLALMFALAFYWTWKDYPMRSYDHVHRLTRAEMETLRLMACGLNYIDVARIRGVAGGTMRAHVHAIYSKIGINNQIQAALYAWRNGIISISDAWEILMAYKRLKPEAEVTVGNTRNI